MTEPTTAASTGETPGSAATERLRPGVDDLFDGRYRLGRVIGQGGYARVYEAVDQALGRTVALKVIVGDGADSADVARVRSEIRLLASLSHPSLVTLYDARLEGSPAYLSMELIAGPTLSDLIARERRTGAETARIGQEIAEAFAVIHSRGIVHRDVKPSNILLRPAAHSGASPRATLADFGIASLVGATRLTGVDTVIGTAAYLSPEQARGMPPAPASDIYSLGLVLLEALTARRPFSGSTPHEALAARLITPPPIPAEVPAPWRAVLESMTAVNPGERPDAAGVIAALRPLSESSASPATSATTRLPASTAPTRVLDAAAGAGAGAAAGAGAGAAAGAAAFSPDDAETQRFVAAPPRPTPGPAPRAVAPSTPGRTPAAREKGSRRTAILVASVIVLLLAIAGVFAYAAFVPGAPQPDFPSLPQPLDQHIEDLWREVGP